MAARLMLVRASSVPRVTRAQTEAKVGARWGICIGPPPKPPPGSDWQLERKAIMSDSLGTVLLGFSSGGVNEELGQTELSLCHSSDASVEGGTRGASSKARECRIQ